MNKFFTLAVLGLSSLTLAAAGTDQLTTALIKAQHPEFDYSGKSDSAPEFEDFTIVGESGAEYMFHQAVAGTNQYGDEFWAITWNHYPDPAGYMTSAKSGGYITKIELSVPEKGFSATGYAPEFEFYVSEEPMPARTDTGKGKSITLTHGGNGKYIWNADGHYKYLFLSTAQREVGSIAVSYSDNAPQLQVKTPEISCYAWDGYVPGSDVNISTETPDATLHITSYIDGEEYETATVEQSYTTVQLPGKPGEEVTYVVYATKDGFTDSGEAMETFDLVEPRLSTPSIDGYVGEVYPSYVLVYRCTDNSGNDIEGATIKYNTFYINWDNTDLNWTGETMTATLPLTVTVPENVTPGGYFGIEGVASAEGYRDSNELYCSYQVISTNLDVPTVSIPSGSEVKAGERLQIIRPARATAIHYVVNDGEEVTVQEYSAYITLEEDCTIRTWATAEAPFTDSEVLTVSYTIEKFGEWADVIYPSDFKEFDSDCNGNFHHTDLSFTREFTGATYNYQGRLWHNSMYDTDVCYITNKNDNFIYTSGTPKSYIKRFKIDCPIEYGACYILFGSEPFGLSSVTDQMTQWDDVPGRIRVGGDNNAEYGWGEWINLAALKDVKGLDVTRVQHFILYRYGQNAQISRVCVEYLNDEELTGIEDVVSDAENGVVGVYNLSGIRVDGENLAPGIYIRKTNGKSEKFIVR
ncbi:MAG: hypothetical protein K2H03_07090 [Muribaculaceae bacterium]|nr:hypothetical protein [Muribaculaceae bacterium]